jgi:hypothetical protein
MQLQLAVAMYIIWVTPLRVVSDKKMGPSYCFGARLWCRHAHGTQAGSQQPYSAAIDALRLLTTLSCTRHY